MGLILAAVVLAGTILICILIMFANMMLTAPTPENTTSPWPVLIAGLFLTAILLASHAIGW